MSLYVASIVLGVWPIIKACGEVWRISPGDHTTALNDLKGLVKNRFKELAMLHHPDRGGDHSQYVGIQQAYDIVKSATISNIIDAIQEECKLAVQHYRAGSPECRSCSKWSDICGVCATTSCSGFSNYSDVKFKDCKTQVGSFLVKAA